MSVLCLLVTAYPRDMGLTLQDRFGIG